MMACLDKSISAKIINFYDFNEFKTDIDHAETKCGCAVRLWKDCNLLVTLKPLEKKDFIVKEVEILQNVSFHPNISRLYGITKDPLNEHYYTVLQYAENGNLQNYLNDNFSKLQLIDKARIAIEIVKGVAFLHKHKIIHKNIYMKTK
ncbi:kinase-like protein [Gigaspora margarita]|uniref:Kinase-like protein n=1 Tax=Gigaspora margarita TaxID=4874 RepID=A0A8H4AKM4_GIGMA|nr:kinase-like protein [Gigaspora margarita]